VREQAKGPAATKRFAALLPNLPPDAQVGLLGALADRADHTARPAVLEMLKSHDEPVRVAALRALGSLGDAADVPFLGRSLAAAAGPEKAAARDGLVRLRGQAVNAAIVAELKRADPGTRVELIGVLASRRALDATASLLAAAEDADASVRAAAVAALGQLAGPEHLAAMLHAVLKAQKGPEREAAEKAVMFVCNRVKDPARRAEPLLAAWSKLGEDDRTALLPTLGRVGGDQRPQRREAGLRALCNWPDASVATRLLDLAQTAGDAEHRLLALRALIRVAPLPDQRPAAEKLDLMKKAMSLAARDEERNLVLRRCEAIRTIESLRFVAPYMDQPTLAQQAAATVVELAHHRELREPNKAEFDRALDAAIRISEDAKIIDRAKRYKKGQT
jgi:HEAT repeat protein